MKSRVYHIIIFMFLALASQLTGQSWERIYDEGLAEYTSQVISTPDGGFALVGYQNETTLSGKKISLIKTSSKGQVEWIELLGNAFSQQAHDFLLNDGHFYIVGEKQTTSADNADLIIIATNAYGELVWEKTLGESHIDVAQKIIKTEDGNLLIIGSKEVDLNSQIISKTYLVKIDLQGNLIWEKTYGSAFTYGVDVIELANGDLVTLSESSPDGSFLNRDLIIQKLNASGNEVWMEIHGSVYSDHANALIETNNNDFAISYYVYGGPHTHEEKGLRLLLLDANGQEIWTKAYTHFDATPGSLSRPAIGHALAQTTDGGFALSGETFDFAPFEGFLIQTNASGEETWRRSYTKGGNNAAALTSMQLLDNGYFIMGGCIHSGTPNGYYLVLADATGHRFTNILQGEVFVNEDQDCSPAIWEARLDNWKISIQGNQQSWEVNSVDGMYQLDVDTGTYTVNLIPPNTLWQSCNPSMVIDFPSPDSTVELDLGADIISACPQLSVDITNGYLEVCEPSLYVVEYCNTGTVDASGVFVELDLDAAIQINTASIPYTLQNGMYRFDIGDLSVQQCGTFSIDAILDCNVSLNETHCVKAHIYPDSICQAPDPAWGGASVKLTGECQGDSIRFTLENIGAGSMNVDGGYIVIIDDVILRSGNYQLNSGEAQQFTEEADGSTFRVETGQVPGHPGFSNPSVSLESCGGTPISTGFVNQFPQDDANHFVDIQCTQNLANPMFNEVEGFPLGYGSNHYIKSNQEIEYLIRFQNTSSEVVQRLIIKDTLSPFLDANSLVAGASSHDYQVEVLGQGIVQFVFDNIQLDPEITNAAASKGFIKFTLLQQPDNPLGTVINHEATLFFDLASPIKSNRIFHTVEKDFVPREMTTSTSQAVNETEMSLFPNPFHKKTTLQFKTQSINETSLLIYDLFGQLVRSIPITGPTTEIYRDGLTSGIYSYTVQQNGIILNRGKLILQ